MRVAFQKTGSESQLERRRRGLGQGEAGGAVASPHAQAADYSSQSDLPEAAGAEWPAPS